MFSLTLLVYGGLCQNELNPKETSGNLNLNNIRPLSWQKETFLFKHNTKLRFRSIEMKHLDRGFEI